jgi:hypothetical protein
MVIMASFPEAALWSALKKQTGIGQDLIALMGETIRAVLDASKFPRLLVHLVMGFAVDV